MPKLEQLDPVDFKAVSAYWRETHPELPLDDFLLRERIFGPPDASPENTLCCFNGSRLAGLSLVVPPEVGSFAGGIRLLSIHPRHRRRGYGSALLSASLARLKALGAGEAHLLSTPPYYIQPGVNIREIETIAWLMRRGFELHRTNCNMTVRLSKRREPKVRELFAADAEGYRIRRAEEGDLNAFEQYCLREWTPGWTKEAMQSFSHDPIALFLAVKDHETDGEEIAGFAAYDVNQCRGSFGPTGVTPSHQGRGLGRRLLWAALVDMRKKGYKESQIGWIGPADFYYRACGATLGPVFWSMKKRV